MEDTLNKLIMDVCCGGRMMWFDKNNKDTLFCDIRECEKGHIEACPNWSCKPDVIADYRNLPFENNSFKLIVWDIPHIIKNSGGIINKKYGNLGENWKELTDMLNLFPIKPLFGTRTKKSVNSTYWICFFKTE